MNNNDVWIKQGDYFSPALEVEPEDIGAPLKFLVDKYVGENSRKAKFVYDDTWGSIVLRREAWICIKNLVSQKGVLSPTEIVHEILRQQEKKSRFNFRENELEHTDISRFYEKLMLELFK